MTDNEKAKILLQYGTLKNYVVTIMKNNEYNSYHKTDSSRVDVYRKYDSAEIGEEWNEETSPGFINDGYSRDTVAHELWSDAIYESKENMIYIEAEILIEKFFNKDQDMIKPIVDYLFG